MLVRLLAIEQHRPQQRALRGDYDCDTRDLLAFKVPPRVEIGRRRSRSGVRRRRNRSWLRFTCEGGFQKAEHTIEACARSLSART